MPLFTVTGQVSERDKAGETQVANRQIFIFMFLFLF